MVDALNLKPPVLIKPNWGTVECYSNTTILDWVLAAIPGEKLVIESHGWARTEAALLHQPAGGLTKANLRKGDAWFLGFSGVREVLEKHHVSYLNLTEEIWAGRAADAAQVRQVVEDCYAPVQNEEQYARVPARLFELRGGTLLSLAKFKVVFDPLGVSLSIKNLFGLVPGPSRGKYHGPNHSLLDQSIVDINKIYSSLFTLKGMIETVGGAGFVGEDATNDVRPVGEHVFAGQHLPSLDAFATALTGRDPAEIGHLRLAGQTFGAWAPELRAEAANSNIRIA
jgi:uncharacterized protein (DUF362 family)